MRRLSIVIPVYNEAGTIAKVIARVRAVSLPTSWDREVVVVDDGSRDGTGEVLKNLSGIDSLILRKENGGKGAALKDGFRAATGDYVLIQDADLEYDPVDYSRLLEPINTGRAKIVFGSRVLGKNVVPFSRFYFYGGLLVTKLFNWCFKTRLTDLATCYKIFPRSLAVEAATLSANDFVFDVVQLSRDLVKNEKIVEIPITYTPRSVVEGKKINWKHGVRCLLEIIHLFFTEKPYLKVLLVFTMFFVAFALVYFSVNTLSSGDDHYFHFRFALEMRENGFLDSFRNFKSIYLSKMAQGNEYFVYYNFLFYLIIIPFTYIQPLFLGIKLYAVLAAALAFTALYWAIGKVGVRYPFVATLVIFALTSFASIWRFFLSRPYALAPTLLILLLVFLYRKKYFSVFLVSLFYFYWHSATFFLPLVVSLIYFLFEKFHRAVGSWKNVVSSLIGTIIAVGSSYLFAPGILSYIHDTVFGIYWETIIGKKIILPEGGELYPVDFFNFLQAHPLIIIALLTAVGVEIYRYWLFRLNRISGSQYLINQSPERQHLQSTLFFLSIGFFLSTVLVSSRFGDYLVFLVGLYLALAFDSIFRFVTIDRMVRKGLLVGVFIVLGYLSATNLLFLQQMISQGSRVDEFALVGQWLREHTQPGDVVFNPNWSWFPQLYYHSPKNNYLTGLEPRFSYVYNPKFYWGQDHIARNGFVCEEESCPIKEQAQRLAFRQEKTAKVWYAAEGSAVAEYLLHQLKSPYIVSSRGYVRLNSLLDNSDRFKKVFESRESPYFIYQVN
jgi:glycosyltransferase involved in cell wall biosynthesis